MERIVVAFNVFLNGIFEYKKGIPDATDGKKVYTYRKNAMIFDKSDLLALLRLIYFPISMALLLFINVYFLVYKAPFV